MKLGLVGPSYQESSLPFDAQRTINLMPVVDETKKGKEISALYATPGLALFATAGIGPVRGEFYSTNGRAFVVSNTEFYEITSAATLILRGILTSDVSNITMDENTTQLSICDGEKIYIFNYATNVFSTPTLAAYPAYTVTELDGYFIYNTDLGQYYICALNDGTSWNVLDFATAESSPDGLVRVIAALGQLFLLGAVTGEVHYNSGDLEFPFQRIEGARMDVGIAAAHTAVEVDNTVIWLGQTKDGKGLVYKASGYTPKKISTFAIDAAFFNSGDLSNIRSYIWQQKGRLIVTFTGGNLETTYNYDLSIQQWFETAYLEDDGSFSTHKALTCMYAFGKHLVGDKSNGNIYEMSPAYYDDAGREIRAQRIFTHLSKEGKKIKISQIQIDFERGVGLITGQGSAPVAWIRIGIDGGRSWGAELQTSIGAIGVRLPRAVWRKMGINEELVTIEVTISDPVKRAICGAYAK